MMSVQFVFLLFFAQVFRLEAKNFHPGLYQADKHHITILNSDNYKQILFDQNSNVMYFVEFYAHWCGTCRRYAPVWINLASEAKSWQNVVKFAALNCGDSLNTDVCTEFEIDMYPTVRLFPVRPKFNPPLHGGVDLDSRKKSSFISDILAEIEKSNNPFWPNLKPFRSIDLGDIFSTKKRIQNYAFLILETDALVAKKIIMDFSGYLDNFVVRRTSWTDNADLFRTLKIDNSTLPGVIVIENLDNRVFYKLLNEKINTANKDFRETVNSGIKEYIKTAPYVNHKIITSTRPLETTSVEKIELLKNITTNMNMQDLETGLSLIIRNEIPHSGVIKGEEFYALRRWIRTLVLYFPGRQEVKNYLTNLDRKLSSITSNQITADQWIQMTREDQTNESYLPESTEWAHCKGSTPNYRGFPCSLWTLFHTLTVHQYELEASRQNSFKQGFNVREVIESIRYFVESFFRCSECSKNFKKETKDYIDHLKEPHDAVLYLWKVHNSVNKRLENDVTTDPLYPKVQFPSPSQCHNCYNSSNELVPKEVMNFFLSFYGSKNIVPILNEDHQDLDFNGLYENDFKNFRVDFKSHNKNIEGDQVKLDKIESSSRLPLLLLFLSFVIFGSCYLYSSARKSSYKLQKHIV